MAKVALILPHIALAEAAKEMARRYQLDLLELPHQVFSNPYQVMQAIEYIQEQGGAIALSRGSQAKNIRMVSTLPVVEIRLTMHEVFQLVVEAVALTGCATPQIALIGPDNMYCDLSGHDFHAQLGIDFRFYPFAAQYPDQMEALAARAIEEGAQAIIGGRISCEVAARHSLPCVRVRSGVESLQAACRMARQVSYAIDLEKRTSANFRAILDYTGSGILQLDETGAVQHMNLFVERVLKQTADAVRGQLVWELIADLSRERLAHVLYEGKEIYYIRVKLHRNEFMASITPVLLDKTRVTGAIICLYESKSMETLVLGSEAAQANRRQIAWHSFSSLIARSETMKEIIAQAQNAARYESPVLITGESGVGQLQLCECIHRESRHARLPFVSVACDSDSPAAVEHLLFGTGENGHEGEPFSPGLLYQPGGVVYLQQVSALSPLAQRRLTEYLTGQPTGHSGALGGQNSRLRVVATDSGDIKAAVRTGSFCAELYYALSVVRIHLPPLRQRREDIDGWVAYYLAQYQKSYGRVVRLSTEAMELLHDYDWPGNLHELCNICQRILARSPKQTVSAPFLASLLEPELWRPTESVHRPKLLKAGTQVEELRQLLSQYNGSRTAVAQALGISATTLWRRMKSCGML